MSLTEYKAELKTIYLSPAQHMGPTKRQTAKSMGYRWDGEIWSRLVGQRLFAQEFKKAEEAGLSPTESGDVGWANCPPEDEMF